MQDIATLAARMTRELNAADITTLNQADADALHKLFDAVSWDKRDALDERRRQLWRKRASVDPDWGALQRTRLVRELPWVTDAVLVTRIDTGQLFIVSTNDDETYVFLANDQGTVLDRDEIMSVSGRGQTRAEAIAGIDAHDGELYPRRSCPHRRGAIDLDSGAWHCYGCGSYLYEDDDED